MRTENIKLEGFEIPKDESLENTILAECIAEPQFLMSYREMLSEGLFTQKPARECFSVLLDMVEKRETIDLSTISARIDKAYLVCGIMPRAQYTNERIFQDHCAALMTLMQRRKLYFKALEGLQVSADPSTTIERVMQVPAEMSADFEKGVQITTIEDASEVFEKLAEKLDKGAVVRIPTSFSKLDWLLYGGFTEGELVVLAARPSVGKTAFMLQMARAAAGAGRKAFVLSLEMTNMELAQRLLASTELVNNREMSQGRIDWQNFERAKTMFKEKSIFFDDRASTIEDVCTRISLARMQGRCDIAFIDYLQLMSSVEKHDSVNYQVAAMTKRLKGLAKSLRIPIVLLSQLSRAAANQRPKLSDLRDSGSIEQDADIVIMLERLKNAELENTNHINMYVEKNRAGMGGGIRIQVDANESYSNFYEVKRDD